MEEQTKKPNLLARKPWVASLIYSVLIFGALAVFLSWQKTAGTISIENSVITAPVISLSPNTAGTLNALYVKKGDIIAPNTPVALVGTGVITSKEGGIVSVTPEGLGGYFNPGATVVSVIKIDAMKVSGTLEENKGLKDVAVGQDVTFTVDAFPHTVYHGIVDTVSPTSVETGVAFAISDKRPIRKFTIEARFVTADYPELKNGMSAKMTVHTR